MDSNLSTAKQAIQAEISHAKEGVAYYEKRVQVLTQALQQLEVAANPDQLQTNKVSGKRAGSRKPGRPRLSNQVSPAKGRSQKLPATGDAYWSGFVKAEPQTAPEILKAAVATLGFTPASTDVKKLRNRMVFQLNSLVRTKKIADTGKGRDRKFFKTSDSANQA